MSTIKLPPLPVSPESVYFDGDGNEPGELVPMYSGTQMRAYAEEAVSQALESAAAIADHQHFGGGRDDDLSWTDCAALIAAEIRALIPENRDG